jgi:hypothetical protein
VLGVVILVVTWAAAGWCALQVLRAAGRSSGVASLALAAGLLAVVPGELCRITGDLRASMLLAGVAFVAAGAWLRRRVVDVQPLVDRTWPAWPAWIVGAFGLACVVNGALTRNFFDEEHHVPMAMVIARGLVPPEHPLVPGQVIPYHWGIDALYAQLVVGGLRPDRAIDVVTIASWILLLLAASTVGAAMAGRAGATLGVILIPLAGSPLAQPLHDGMGILQPPRVAYPSSWFEWFRRPPPLTADFFQHPQGLAFPIVLVVLVLFCGPRPQRVVGALLLALLSLVQAVHFLVLGAALGACVVVELVRARDARSATRDLGLLAGALVVAIALGGFFSPGTGTGSSLAWGQSFFGEQGALENIAHHVVAFGLPLLLLPLAPRLARFGVPLFAGAVVGFVLPNVVVYKGSWDIVKLFSAAGFLAGAALTGTLATWVQGKLSRVVVTALVTLATIEFPLVWMASRTVMQGVLDVPVKRDWRLRDDVLGVGRAVSPLIPAKDLVLVNDAELARMNGLLAPGFDSPKFASGHILDFTRVKQKMQMRQLAMTTMDARALHELGVRWVLVSEAEAARGPVETSPAVERVDLNGLEGYRLYRVR